MYELRDRHADYEAMRCKRMEVLTAAHGPHSHQVQRVATGLGDTCCGRQQYSKAVRYYRRAVDSAGMRSGMGHHDVIEPLRGLALAYTALNRLDEAEPEYERLMILLRNNAAKVPAETAIGVFREYAAALRASGCSERAADLERAARRLEKDLVAP